LSGLGIAGSSAWATLCRWREPPSASSLRISTPDAISRARWSLAAWAFPPFPSSPLPPGLHHADHGLAATMRVDMFNLHRLLPAALQLRQGFDPWNDRL
jgi:hypothetical protein